MHEMEVLGSDEEYRIAYVGQKVKRFCGGEEGDCQRTHAEVAALVDSTFDAAWDFFARESDDSANLATVKWYTGNIQWEEVGPVGNGTRWRKLE